MRIAGILAAVAAALVLASTASASIWPAPVPGSAHAGASVRYLTVPRTQHLAATTRACARGSKAARWLVPVACEHPPRSEVLILPLLGG